jgi:hypothetical protein
MADSVIWTTQEDINAERETIRRWREQSARLWDNLHTLESVINEYQIEIDRIEQRIHSRAEEISRLQTSIARHESRLLRVSPVERYIIEETVKRIRRVESALYGWQTRETHYLETLRKAQHTEKSSVDHLASRIQELEGQIQAEESRLSRKKVKPPEKPPKNLIIALHKRWQYKSSRGAGHDISIEAVATIIVGPEAHKEDYEDELERALEEAMHNQPGFERLIWVTPEVLGFEERLTDQKQRGIKVEQVSWEHKIVQRQLNITDFL